MGEDTSGVSDRFADSESLRLDSWKESLTGEWNYDVTPDGQRFVINLARDDSPPAPIAVILNWATGLGR